MTKVEARIRLDDIGFYTLSEERAATASDTSRLQRCEMVLSSRCNFKCPYCRRVGGDDISFPDAEAIVRYWGSQNLRAIRFSGGEPTLFKGVDTLVSLSRHLGMEWIAISSNGSAKWEVYERLIASGANDFSISLDACCAEDGDKMAGGVKGAWSKVIETIRRLSGRVYTTVGVVLTDANAAQASETIAFAASLGVHDIRVIPAAQKGERLADVAVDDGLLDRFPILRYRVMNLREGRPVRGIGERDSRRCGLVLDDMAVCGDEHYPCIIYMREGGKPIGKIGPETRRERAEWARDHDTSTDPICSRNCLDVCVDYNNAYQKGHS